MAGIFRTVAIGSASVTGARLITKVVSLASVYLVVNALSTSDFGVVTLALTVSGPVLAISGFGLDDIVLSTAARMRGEGNRPAAVRLMRGLAFLRLGIAAVAVAAMGFVPGLLGPTYGPVVSGFLLPLQGWVALNVLASLTGLGLQLRERFVFTAAETVVEAVVRLSVLAFFFFNGGLAVSAVLWAYVLAKAAGLVVTFPGIAAYLGGAPLAAAFGELWKLIRLGGKWEVARGLTGQLFSGVDLWVLGLVSGLAAVAMYSLAKTMVSVISQLLPFRQVLFPMLSRLSSERENSSFISRRMVKYGVWLTSLLILAVSPVLPFAVGALFPKYFVAVPLFYALLPSLILMALSVGHGPLLYAFGEQRFLLGLTFLTTASSLTVLPALCFFFGPFGAAIEYQLGTAALIAVRERRLIRHGLRSFVLRDVLSFDDFDRKLVRRLWRGIRGIAR